jgi:HEAT repeat protein
MARINGFSQISKESRCAILGISLVLGFVYNVPLGAQMLSGKPLAQWIAQLDDLAPPQRLMAAYQLAGCGPSCSQALKALQRKLDDRDESVRIGVARAIVNIDATGPEERAIDVLTDAVRNGLSQRGGTVSTQAIRGLGDAGPRAQRAIPLLQQATHHWAGSVQSEARRALAKIQGNSR